MTYIKWFLLALASILMLVPSYLLAPALPLFAIGRATLPAWLSWFQTPDNSLDGDDGWKTVHWQWRYRLPAPLASYVGRVGWLWRNPAYGFDFDVLGVTISVTPTVTGTIPLGGSPAHSGWFFARSPGAFQFYAFAYWGSHASRVDFGWKLWSAPGRCQFAMTVSPFMSVNQ